MNVSTKLQPVFFQNSSWTPCLCHGRDFLVRLLPLLCASWRSLLLQVSPGVALSFCIRAITLSYGFLSQRPHPYGNILVHGKYAHSHDSNHLGCLLAYSPSISEQGYNRSDSVIPAVARNKWKSRLCPCSTFDGTYVRLQLWAAVRR